MSPDEILSASKKEADKWFEVYRHDGSGDPEGVLHGLQGRTWKGDPVEIKVVQSPSEVPPAVREAIPRYASSFPGIDVTTQAGVDQAYDKIASYRCIWSYYLMAFYSIAFRFYDGDDAHEFGRQCFFEAFRHGLGFYVNHARFAVAVMMPHVKLNEESQIHCADGPAIVWGKDLQYWWEGVQVPESWIMQPDSVDPSKVFTLENIEERGILRKILGWERVLKCLSVRVVDEHDSPYVGQLIEVDLPDERGWDEPPARFLKVLCATGKIAILRVSPYVKTALEGNAMSNRLRVDQLESTIAKGVRRT